jgi:hypothetical protein
VPLLDLDYQEDVKAETDMNVVCTGDARFVEVQGTAEGQPFDRTEIDTLLGQVPQPGAAARTPVRPWGREAGRKARQLIVGFQPEIIRDGEEHIRVMPGLARTTWAAVRAVGGRGP